MPGWTALLPVKRLELAKSRLALPGPLRADLVLAMAADTVAAAAACPAVVDVVVVTADATAADVLGLLGAVVVGEPPAGGLNRALAEAAALARRREPAAGVVAITADLPGLRPADLGAVLAAVPPGAQGVVADAAGTGSTVLAASSTPLNPSFGPGSFRRHLGSGAVDLTRFAAPGLRRDVDTVADLRAAVVLGVGPRTGDAGRRLAR